MSPHNFSNMDASSPPDLSASGSDKREVLLFAALVILHLIPVWLYSYFPSQDGPSHLATASILRQYFQPDAGILSQYFEINHHLSPNLLVQIILVPLLFLVPPLLAEKIFLSLYILLFPLSVRYALGGIRPDAKFLAVFIFPFIYNWTLYMGFYNFVLSLVVFFSALGYWLKHWERLGIWKTTTLALLLVILYLCHPVSLVMAYAALGVLCVWALFFKPGGQRANRGSGFLKTALPTLCAMAPSVVLMAVFIAGKGTQAAEWQPPFFALKVLLTLGPLVSLAKTEYIFSAALSILFGLFFLYSLNLRRKTRGLTLADGLLAVFAVYLLAYFTAPDNLAGGGYLMRRLGLYPWFILILWFGTFAWKHRARRVLQIAAVVMALCPLFLHTLKQAELDGYIKEFVSMGQEIKDDSTLLPLIMGPARDAQGRPLALNVDPFLHAGGYIAAGRKIVDFGNYQANLDYFPVIFRPRMSPMRFMGKLNVVPPEIDFLSYPAKTGGRVDYALLWPADKGKDSSAAAKSIYQQLADGYELVSSSKPRDLASLYRRIK